MPTSSVTGLTRSLAALLLPFNPSSLLFAGLLRSLNIGQNAVGNTDNGTVQDWAHSHYRALRSRKWPLAGMRSKSVCFSTSKPVNIVFRVSDCLEFPEADTILAQQIYHEFEKRDRGGQDWKVFTLQYVIAVCLMQIKQLYRYVSYWCLCCSWPLPINSFSKNDYVVFVLQLFP